MPQPARLNDYSDASEQLNYQPPVLDELIVGALWTLGVAAVIGAAAFGLFAWAHRAPLQKVGKAKGKPKKQSPTKQPPNQQEKLNDRKQLRKTHRSTDNFMSR